MLNFKKLKLSSKGAGMMEHGSVIALIAVLGLTAVLAMGIRIEDQFCNAAAKVSGRDACAEQDALDNGGGGGDDDGTGGGGDDPVEPDPAVITTVTVPEDGSYAQGDTLSFGLTFDRSVTPDQACIEIQVGQDIRKIYANEQTTSGTFTFDYLISEGDVDEDGLEFTSLSMCGSAEDGDGLTADNTFPEPAPDMSGVLIPAPPPPVTCDSNCTYVGLVDGTVAKLNASGEVVWEKSILRDEVLALAVDPQGNVVVGGIGGGLYKYSADGNQIWAKYHPYGVIYDLAINSSGTIGIATESGVVHFRDANGVSMGLNQDTHTDELGTSQTDWVQGITTGPSGNFFAASVYGMITHIDGNNLSTLARGRTSASKYIGDVDFGPDGNLYVGGYTIDSNQTDGYADDYLYAFRPSGNDLIFTAYWPLTGRTNSISAGPSGRITVDTTHKVGTRMATFVYNQSYNINNLDPIWTKPGGKILDHNESGQIIAGGTSYGDFRTLESATGTQVGGTKYMSDDIRSVVGAP